MRQLRNAVAATVIVCSPFALAASAFAQTCACAPSAAYVIQADEQPPPLPEYDQPPIPAPGYYWTPGYWAWNNYDYYWVPGAWVEPPQPGLLWTPGYWAFGGGAYAFRPGYWAPHVGFYGGIDYGFGYAGAGYQGGRWDNGRFFYNTTVNNIAGAHIANIYNQPITSNTTINRVSFNGGVGGVVAKPTNEELLAEKETHVRATTLQADQARAAGMRSEQFVSTNRGKPTIAATARPGEFKGKGVTPAKAAGKAAQAAPTPAGNAPLETKEKPAALEKPIAPGLAPTPPKIEGKPPAAEKAVRPEAAPNGPKIKEKRPAAEKVVKPEAAPNPPKIEKDLPVGEKSLTHEPKAGVERPGVQPQRKPGRRPEAKECGRPGLPTCPK
jgi:WXXGXW repeat (2 copies)